jgi:hypothetical protein
MSLSYYGFFQYLEHRSRREGVRSAKNIYDNPIRLRAGVKSKGRNCLQRKARRQERQLIASDLEAYAAPLPVDTLHCETVFHSDYKILKHYKRKPRRSVEEILNSQKDLWK